MTPSHPYKDLCYISHIGTILGGFPGRYTRPKTGIFPRSQYELSHIQNFVLRHIGRIAPRLSRDCPISRLNPSRSRTEKFPKNFSQKFRKFSASRHAPSRRNPQNPPKPRKTLFMLPPAEIFPKFFFQIFSQIFRSSGACVEMRYIEKFPLSYIARNFSQKIFPIFLEFLTCM